MPSHGSVTKAGKVRSGTPKIEPKPKDFPPPRIRNRLNYYKRILNAQVEEKAATGRKNF
ncbi:MAG: 30S ribosomal protein S30e [Thaumarchaeota archaeon]|nr:30S ribosomal protein S30e [Candidatus Calditenuaceae archaeon]MDW8187305.1 30S ribosomal protein S30e [Nitrososphaerota archaeon]